MRSRFFWTSLLVILAVFYFVDGHNPFSPAGDWIETQEAEVVVEEGNPWRRVSLILLGVFGVFGLLKRSDKRFKAYGVLSVLVLFFFAWAFLSLVWTDDLTFTTRRLAVLAMLCLGALGVARNFSGRDLAVMVFVVAGFYLLVGFVSEAAKGAFHPLDGGFRFAGSLHPNLQGVNCFLLVLSSLFLAGGNLRIRRTILLAAALVGFAFLILTKSRTAVGGSILALFVYWGLAAPERHKVLVTICAGIIFSLLFLLLGDTLLGYLGEGLLLGRESDGDSLALLTGRVPVWEQCIEFIVERPLEGYGYGAFWTPQNISFISGLYEWGVTQAHSAYMEIALGLGMVGLASYVLLLFLGIGRALTRTRAFRNHGYRFVGVLLVFAALDGLLESTVALPSLLCFLSIVVLMDLSFFDGQAGERGHRVPDIRPEGIRLDASTPGKR